MNLTEKAIFLLVSELNFFCRVSFFVTNSRLKKLINFKFNEKTAPKKYQ